jgi:hypothetical protein
MGSRRKTVNGSLRGMFSPVAACAPIAREPVASEARLALTQLERLASKGS